MYTQIKSPNLGISYTGGWCLKAVCDAFDTDHAYKTATLQWNGVGVQHKELPPAGYSVPIFFSFTTEPDGHIAISLPDGRVASSTQSGTHKGLYIHPNLHDLLVVYKEAGLDITYLGWKDYVGTQQVIKGDNMETALVVTDDEAAELFRGVLKREPGATEINDMKGRYWKERIVYLRQSPGGVAVGDKVAAFDGIAKENADLKAQVTTLQAKIDELEKGGSYKIATVYVKNS